MGAQFTPGPWLADPMVKGAKGAFYIVGNLDGNNATVDVATIGPTLSPRAEANAHLIAAAPELYEALQRITRLRPAGDINTAKSTRALVEQIEIIALRALAKARSIS